MDGIFKNELFDIKPADAWIESTFPQPLPRMVFDRFWSEGELCVLFGDRGKGKSILAFQLAEAIARGCSIEPFQMHLPAQKVLYLDLSPPNKHFEMRYAAEAVVDAAADAPSAGALKDHYHFSTDLLHARPRSLEHFATGRFKSFREYFYEMLHSSVRQTGARVVIIDDLACYLNGGPGRARELAELFRALHELKQRYQLSILVLAHTRRVSSARLTLNDLEYSRLIGHFADSICAIGGSCADPTMRYLKHVKQRSAEPGFDEMNVPVFRVGKQGGNFLSFSFISFGIERDLLQGPRDVIFETDLMERILDLSAEGRTQRDVAESLGISKTTVNRYLQIDARLAVLEMEEQRLKQRPLTPAEPREILIDQAIERQARILDAERAAVKPDTGTAEGSADAGTTATASAAERFYEPDDDKCDCIECLAGHPRRCLEKFSTSARASPT